MDISPILALPLLMPSQAQKHVTHNEALLLLDALVQMSVISRHIDIPPDEPEKGDRYLIPPEAQGDWEGASDSLALWDGQSWVLLPPLLGWRCYVEAEDCLLVYGPQGWSLPPLQTPLLGVNASADINNRLAVSSSAVLLNHAGADHRLKVNKAIGGDTASLLFQTGFSGRAEMGTMGADDFSVKVSADGSLWREALKAVASSGEVEFAHGANISTRLSGTAVVQSNADTTADRLAVVGWMGLGAAAVSHSDANSIAASGFYRLSEGVGNNAPSAQAYHLLHQEGHSGSASQMASNETSLYWRVKVASVWQSWQRCYDMANILGSVSQAFGSPTGALFETGSNANGSYTRFADGSLICRSPEMSLRADIADGAIFRSNAITWAFPSAFVAAPSLTISAALGGQSWASAALTDATFSAALLRCHSATSMSNAQGFYAVAIGRWF